MKCTKKRDARAKLLSLLIEPFDFFFTFSLRSVSLDLKVPIMDSRKRIKMVVWTQINRCVVNDNEMHTFFFKTEYSSVYRALD